MIHIKATTFLIFSSFSCHPVLNGFTKAWYLSAASTVRVNDETAMDISVEGIILQEIVPNPSLRIPTLMGEKAERCHKNGDNIT